MGTQYRQMQSALAHLAGEAARDNWDGYGASAVSQEALAFAKRIAHFLVAFPAPEVSIDPDGEVAFDWRANPRCSMSLSIGPAGTLRYASIMMGSENYGTEPWRDGLPEAVARLIHRTVIHHKTT